MSTTDSSTTDSSTTPAGSGATPATSSASDRPAPSRSARSSAPGRRDPARRERIARAAIDVVAERGLDKLTHRAVAAAAGVPLGSTTYHFASLDDLLAEALRQAAQDNVAQLRSWAARLDGLQELPAALADLVLHYLGPERTRTVVEHELYVAAVHRPALSEASTAWDDALIDLFTSYTDPVTGRMLSTIFCGLLLQGVVRESTPGRDEIETIFRRAFNSVPDH